MGTDFYRVEWIDEKSLLAAAYAAGWKDGDDLLLDAAPPEYHTFSEDFKTYREARAFALRARHSDLWKTARLYECSGPDEYGVVECSESFQSFEAGERKAFREN